MSSPSPPSEDLKRKRSSDEELNTSNTSNTSNISNTPCVRCKCSDCTKAFQSSESIEEHLSNIYAQLNEQSRMIQTQNQTLSTLLSQVIPLLKSIDTKGQQTSKILFKLEKLKE